MSRLRRYKYIKSEDASLKEEKSLSQSDVRDIRVDRGPLGNALLRHIEEWYRTGDRVQERQEDQHA